jgi:translation initiation factor eIF-2B subunit epsilon
MKNIHLYVAKDGYAARVQDTRSYDSVRSVGCLELCSFVSILKCHNSKDILSRWTFPLVPDDNYPGGPVYEHRRGNRYIAKDGTIVLAR